MTIGLPRPVTQDVVGYTIGNRRYLNVTNRCTLRCAFCPKFNGEWEVREHNLRLRHEPSIEEMIDAARDPSQYAEVVFCGLGEPTLRLYDVLEVATVLRDHGARIRINTDGLANLVYGRNVAPDLEGIVDALSVSLNAQNAEVYARHCRPQHENSYEAMLEFVARAREFVPRIVLTALDGLEGVDIDACRAIADKLGVQFRRRVLGVVG